MKLQHVNLDSVDQEVSQLAVQLFRARMHAVTLENACDVIKSWIELEASPCRYVVTPNVDHILQLQRNADLCDAYCNASLVVADGWPVVLASRVLRRPLPERVAGSDLIPELMSRWRGESRSLRVFLLGAAPGVADIAAKSIASQFPDVSVCGTYSPPFGFEKIHSENERIISKVNESEPDLLVVGFGAPKQEIWLSRFAHCLHARVAIAAGGTIDFLAGTQVRAPVWMRRHGLEWLHRLIHDPRRLGMRYLRGAWTFPKLVVYEYARNVVLR